MGEEPALARPLEEIALLGPSPTASRLRSQVERVARTPGTTVLLAGDPGMDALSLARALHAGTEGTGPPLPFLHRTGARLVRAPGIEPPWDRGTIFLEEVGALSDEGQRALLEWLEGSTSGSQRPRLVASSCADLEQRAGEGGFLPDLLYRLNVLTLRVPPLKERREDVPDMARALLAQHRRHLDLAVRLTEEAVRALQEHDWPGNALELESLLVLAALWAEGGRITAGTLARCGLGGDSGAGLVPHGAPLRSLKELEEDMIRRVLVHEKGNRSRAARTLGIHRQTLYNKMRLYGIS